ncbi:MAG: M13 family metallopeptidase [Bacteroidales bacterium]|nr:M13 family metallopeptidase [Bacteroidales bacterium]
MNKLMKSLSVLALSGVVAFGVLQSCSETVQKGTKAIKTEDLDQTANLKENFFQYANGGWMQNHPLPEDRSRYGAFDALAEMNVKQVQEIFTELLGQENQAGTVAQKVGDFFSMGMDSVALNEQGIKPLLPEFQKIENIQTKEALKDYINYAHNSGIGGLFGMFGMADSKNSEMVVTYMWQSGLGMDRDYYTDDNARAEELRAAYVDHVEKMFVLLGDDVETAKANAASIMRMETRLALASMTQLEMRNPMAYYNKMDLEGLTAICPAYDWKMYFEEQGLGDPGTIILGQPEFYKEFSVMLEDVAVENWKSYFRWNLLNSTASYLSDDLVNQNFEFYGKAMSGTPQMRPRWKRVQGVVDGSLSEAIGQIYVKKFFPEAAKQRMVTLVNNLKDAMSVRIENLEWMDDETKVKAQAKLAAMNVKIGYPDKWRDYSGLDIKKDAYVLNVLRAGKFERDYSLNKINKAVDKAEWGMPPQMVNAYYSPLMNEICFPAGILQPPFFFMDADDAVNYGAIGVVIGHEMTHGFDDKGRLYDLDGNLNDWWTAGDAERFEKRTQVLVDQFNDFIVLDTIHADGELSLGENIADLGGLNISYTAFMKALEGKDKKEIDGFTPEQRFFLAYSHVWAQNIRDAEILRRTKEDVHSLGIFRVNGPLPQMPEFHAAFDVNEGDAMFIPAAERAVIW